MTDGARWVRAGLACGVTDFLWACGQTKFMYGGSITRLWQGVASVPFGPSMLDGGRQAALVGVGLHFVTAFTWSALFVFVVSRLAVVRRLLESRGGAWKVAAVYGPFVWTAMSWAVIPSMTHRLPTITSRWFIQLLGHVPFVGLPIVQGAGPARR